MIIRQFLDEKARYGDFFSDTKDLKSQYREYCKYLHPDICKDPNATEAFAQLQKFYELAQKAKGSGYWESSKNIIINTQEKHTLSIPYQIKYDFELGSYYICNNHIIYLIDSGFKSYVNNMKNIGAKIKYDDSKMKDYFSPRVPEIISTYMGLDNRFILVVSKSKEEYALRAAIEYFSPIEAVHFAWMITRLLNLAMFFYHSNLTHNGLTLDACFVNFETHAIGIKTLWYTTPINQKMIGVPKEVFNIMNPKVKSEKISSVITDLETIKSFGRTYGKNCGKAVKAFFSSGSGDPMIELEKWDKALAQDFGERKFIKFTQDLTNIYK